MMLRLSQNLSGLRQLNRIIVSPSVLAPKQGAASSSASQLILPGRSQSTGPASRPITLVLFDAFDTLLTPRIPIHLQYAEEALKVGLESVNADQIRSAFKTSFRSLEAEWPNYGKGMRAHLDAGIVKDAKSTAGCPDQQQPVRVEDWWYRVIEESLIGSGIDSASVKKAMPSLGKTLLKRFESAEGYRAFEDVLPALEQLKALGVKIGVVTNADDRIVNTFSALGITPYLDGPVITSYAMGYPKPDRRIFHATCKKAGMDLGVNEDLAGALMVGDELEADYRGARRAGLQAVLIRRPGDFSDGAKRQKAEEEEAEIKRDGVRVVTGMNGVVDVVKRSIGTSPV